MKNQSQIMVDEVSYLYDDDEPEALSNVSMTIKQGEFVAILGHNGSGKSTLAKLLNALYLPTTGKVVVLGMDTSQLDEPWVIRQHVGMVFQNPDNQIVATSVEEDVAFGLENIGVPTLEMPARITSALQVVQMADLATSAPHLLSGGQKQRVAIAGILAMNPEILVLDESTAMLDPTGRKEVFQTVETLNREHGITVVWITHFMEEAAKAQRVIVMSDGEIVLSDTPKNVFSNTEKIRSLGLVVPPMTLLASMLIQRGIPISRDILTVDEMVKELTSIQWPSK
ncbi:MAG: energy-coupling factor transporter ATPase [Clostridiales bacterium]|nr:energy-coupling factor transporter ATPase [Clostridiales bacterium]